VVLLHVLIRNEVLLRSAKLFTSKFVVVWVVLRAGRWLETRVSDAVPPPSSGLSFVIIEMYPVYYYLPREVLDA
jgi:hypothetical protein